MPKISVSLGDREIRVLDSLVASLNDYYQREGQKIEALRTIQTNRSSALRDLLSAWDHGMDASEVFPPVKKEQKK